MIEILFAIILGFMVASTLCGLVTDGSRTDLVIIKALGFLFILSCIIVYVQGGINTPFWFIGQARELFVRSISTHVIWFLGGAALALLVQLIAEGYLHKIWINLHPQSAPTPEARFRQRAQPADRSKPVTATLVGTSTEYLNSELDLRTDTLIRLCFFAFEDRGALTLSRLESNLRLGTGRRQKAYHKIVASTHKRPKLKPTLHRYSRSINGSSRLSQGLFADLCRLATQTGNRDISTHARLVQAGAALGLTETDISRLTQGLR